MPTMPMPTTDESPTDVSSWPPLPLEPWEPTRATLHLWTQVVGKIRLALEPPVNHWWHTPLYVTARGLTTSAMPHGDHHLQIDFDFCDHRLEIRHSGGAERVIPLAPRSVARFHAEVMAALESLGAPVRIWTTPVEIEHVIPFEQDHEHKSYDRDAVERFFGALRHADRVMHRFRSDFLGKCSPVHFFWGSFDHAVTPFSGRTAPKHPGGIPNLGDWVVHEAYSHELASFGWWPGDARFPEPAFYAYAYPEPEGFATANVGPDGASYHDGLREWVLPYETVRSEPDAEDRVLRFFRDAYRAAADHGGWDRQALDRAP
jgi:hypothetical protein